MTDGLLDSNVIVHALTNDDHTVECQRFLRALAANKLTVRVEPYVLHEVTYALQRYFRDLSRTDMAESLIGILGLSGVQCEEELLVDALTRWGKTEGLGFVDALLASTATHLKLPVYTKNIKHLRGQGVDVPDPLPGS